MRWVYNKYIRADLEIALKPIKWSSRVEVNIYIYIALIKIVENNL